MFRAGFVSIIGKPNVGKSTLTNYLVGEKVSIVSQRPQTTRNKIIGIMNGDDYQIVLVDTPGVHKPKNALSEYMMRSVDSASDGVDIYIYMIACDKNLDDHDINYINRYASKNKPLFVVINKCDGVEQQEIVMRINRLKDIEGINAIIPISARTGKSCDLLKEEIIKVLPEGQPYYDTELYTDKSVRFMVAEIIREKALRLLGDEIPYGIGININKFAQRPNGIVDIDADIVCEKQAHKAIVIGKNGAKIKDISTQARIDIEKLVDSKVFLTLYVRVKEDWRDSQYLLNELGYKTKDI